MQVKFASSISVEEMNALPSGTVISFGDSCWKKIGELWKDYPELLEVEEFQMPVEVERAAFQINFIMKNYHDIYSQFTIITPYDEEVFGEVVWSESDIENAFEQLGYKVTPERKAAVLDKVKPVIEDAMISIGWSVIYDAVDEVCEDEDD